MKEFNFGFRDVLMYLVPGFLTITALSFIVDFELESLTIKYMNNDVFIVSFFLSVSFLVGFFVSTLMKVPINRYFYTEEVNYLDPFFYLVCIFRFIIKTQYYFTTNQAKDLNTKKRISFKTYKLRNIMKIDDLDFKSEIKDNLTKKIKVDFEIKNEKPYLKNGQLFFFCARFVDNYSTKEGCKQANREFDLGNFLLSTTFPVILYEIVLIQSYFSNLYLNVTLNIICPVLTIIFILNRYIKHRNAWIRNIYRLFYITYRHGIENK